MFACQCDLHVNMPKACLLLIFMGQLAMWLANVSTSPANIANFVSIFQRDDANVPKGMTIFQAFLQNAKGNFYTLSYKNILYNT